MGVKGEAAASEAGTTKEQVLEYIRNHPGAHLRQIQRELDISMGAIQYHLYSLEKDKTILARRRGLYKRFYPCLMFAEQQQEILDILSQETERDIVLFLIENPNATQKELSEYAKISPGTINWHMKRLVASGIVKPEHKGQYVKYKMQGEIGEILKLVQNYHPRIWDSWVDRLANAISEVSQPTAGSETEISDVDDDETKDSRSRSKDGATSESY